MPITHRISLFWFFLCSFLLVNSTYADTNASERGFQRFASENKVAVVVGIDAYDRPSGLPKLKYAVADANGLKTVLEKQGYSGLLLKDQKANSGYILDAIEQAGKMVTSQQGTLIFAFSGHGFAENETNYLATYGTVTGRLQTTALPITAVIQAI